MPQVSNNPGVTVGLIAAAAANVVIAFVKARWGFDCAGQEANLTMLAVGAGYWIQGREVPA
jgi:hypothetical protein